MMLNKLSPQWRDIATNHSSTVLHCFLLCLGWENLSVLFEFEILPSTSVLQTIVKLEVLIGTLHVVGIVFF